MAIYFLDSSALVKRYVREAGSAWIDSLLDPSAAHVLHIASITGVEVAAAIARRSLNLRAPATGEAILSEFRDDYASMFRLIEINQQIIEIAMSLAGKHRIRGYDALQLSLAIQVHLAYAAASQSMTFLSADDELNEAATLEGLAVENPNQHP